MTQTSKEWTEKEISNRHNALKNQLLDKLNIEQLKNNICARGLLMCQYI